MDAKSNSVGSKFACFTALCALTLLSQASALADSVLGITNDDHLISFNSSNPSAATSLGVLDTTSASLGLFKNGSSLYVYDTNQNVVRQINPTNAATINTINIGLAAAPGEGDVVFSNGVGYLVSTDQPDGSFDGFGTLFRFTLSANSATVISNAVPMLDGLTFSNGVLYGLSQGGTELYTINAANGATTPVGATRVTCPANCFSFGGLATALDGSLYATLANFSGATSEFLVIDPKTGQATVLGNIPFAQVSGIFDNSTTPEPSTLLLVFTAGSLLIFAVRRRSRELHALAPARIPHTILDTPADSVPSRFLRLTLKRAIPIPAETHDRATQRS